MPLIAQTRLKPRVILGLMTFGPDPSLGARLTEPAQLSRALDVLQARGYNELDTARMYAGRQQEAWTRQAGWKDRGFSLATKVLYPANRGDNAPEKVKESVEISLKDLGTDCVDILYLHAPDRGTPFKDTLAAVNDLYKAGKFVRLGLSNFTAFEVAEVVMTCAANGWVRPTIYQGMYNAITRQLESELIPACRRYGLDVVVYNPLAGGLFSGKIRTRDAAPATGRFSDTANNGKQYRDRYFRDATFGALAMVEEAGGAAGLTMLETALRWLVHHSKLNVGGVGGAGGNDGVIVGVSSVEQLEQNLDMLERGPLPEKVVEALDDAWRVSKADVADYWHQGALEYGYDTQKALFGAKA